MPPSRRGPAVSTSEDARSGPGLAEALGRFVNDYRKHMAMEEEHLFPAAPKALSEQDREDIDFRPFDNPDPLFDHAAHERFHGLRERINVLARGSQRRSARLCQLKQPGALTSVDKFNVFLETANYAYRLESKPEGGYTVKTDSRPLADIPACEVTQAIWHAYYCVQGLEEEPV